MGVIDSGYPANLDFRQAFQSASQFLRNIREFHGGVPRFFPGAICESPTGQTGKYSRPSGYSLKRRGWEGLAAAAAGFRRAMPTNLSTVTSESAARGTKMRSVEELRSGEVICRPLTRSDSKSFGTTPSRVSPSLKRSFTHKPSSFGRLRNALRSGSKSSENSRTK